MSQSVQVKKSTVALRSVTKLSDSYSNYRKYVIGLIESQSYESKCFHFLLTPLGYYVSVELRARDRRSCKRIKALFVLNHHPCAFVYNLNFESVINKIQPFLIRSCDFTLAAINGTEKVGHELQSDSLSARLLFKLIDV